MRVKLLREPEIRQLLSLPEAIQAMEKCLADFSSGKAIVPGVVNLDLEDSQGEVHVKSAHLKGGRHYVIKIASGFYRNPVRGLPVGNGLMLLFEAETGLLECIMFDKGYITEMRTAAAGAVAAKYLAKKTLHKVGLVGSGSQARFQVRALLEVRWPKEVWVWSRSSDHVLAYIAEMSGLCPQVRFIRAKDCQDAVRASDLIITATPSRSPLVKASWLKAGVHITALGSDGPEKQELEVDVLARADLVFCDSTSQCAQLGEIHHGLEKKAISEDRITGEIGDIILGRKRGRETENQITIADLTGIGAQDAAAASLVFEKASLRNLGDSLEI